MFLVSRLETQEVLMFQFDPKAEKPDVFVLVRKNSQSACQCRRCKRCGFDPRVGTILWSRKWHLSPVFLPEKLHSQRSLADCNPRATKSVHYWATEHYSLPWERVSLFVLFRPSADWRRPSTLRRTVCFTQSINLYVHLSKISSQR